MSRPNDRPLTWGPVQGAAGLGGAGARALERSAGGGRCVAGPARSAQDGVWADLASYKGNTLYLSGSPGTASGPAGGPGHAQV